MMLCDEIRLAVMVRTCWYHVRMDDDVIRYDGGVDDSDELGYEGADVARVHERAHYEGKSDSVDLPVDAPDGLDLVESGGESVDDAPKEEADLPDHREQPRRGIDPKKAVGAAGAAVVLAATLGTAAVDTEQATLPEPVPIVQSYDLGSDTPSPDAVTDADAQDEKRSSGWELFLKLLKYLIVLIIAIIALIFGLIKGCASCAVPLLGPADDDKKQEQQEEDMQAAWLFDESTYAL